MDVMFTETSMIGGNWAASWATALEDDWALDNETCEATMGLIDGGIEEDCTGRTGDEIEVLALEDLKGEYWAWLERGAVASVLLDSTPVDEDGRGTTVGTALPDTGLDVIDCSRAVDDEVEGTPLDNMTDEDGRCAMALDIEV